MGRKHRYSVAGAWIGAIVVMGFLSGCSHNIPLKATVDRPLTVSQIQATVGVYYSPEFKSHEHVSEGRRPMDLPLGTCQHQAFRAVLPHAVLEPASSGKPSPAAR